MTAPEWVPVRLRYAGGECWAMGHHTGRGWLLSLHGVMVTTLLPAPRGKRVLRWGGTLAELGASRRPR